MERMNLGKKILGAGAVFGLGLLLVVGTGCPPPPGPSGPCSPNPCDDENPCTDDTCAVDAAAEEGYTCTFTPVECEEGFVCDEATGDCVEAECIEDADCGDLQICTDNACVDVECIAAEDCEDDGLFCTGDPVCENNVCGFSGDPCAADETCDDDADACIPAIECTTNADCVDDGLFCTGDPVCVGNECDFTGDPCPEGTECDEEANTCGVVEETFTLTPATLAQAEGDSGTNGFVYTVGRAGDVSAAHTLDWAVTGNAGLTVGDFVGGAFPSGTVAFAAGDSADKTITVNVAGDTSIEADETFTLTLTDPDDADAEVATATGTIENDDATDAPVITLPTDATAQVGQTSAVEGISISDADNSTSTVNIVTADGFISFSIAPPPGCTAVDGLGNAVTLPGTLKDEYTLTGTITAINAYLSNFRFTTSRSDAGTDEVAFTATDADGGEGTGTLSIAVGIRMLLTGASDTIGFTGTDGGDNYDTTAATDLGQGDILNGGAGEDMVTLNAFGAAAVPSGPLASFLVTSVETAYLRGAVGGANALDLSLIGGLHTAILEPGVSAGNLDLNMAPQPFTLIYRPGTALNWVGRNIDVDIKDAAFIIDDVFFTLRLEGNGTIDADFAVLASTVGNIDIVNIVSTSSDGGTADTRTNTMGVPTINVPKVNISGDQRLTTGAWGGAATTAINATGFNAQLITSCANANANITGGNMNDTLTGGAGTQTLSGGPGNDILNPGAAADLVATGTGLDSIVLAAADVAPAGGGLVYDRWADFTPGAGGDFLDYGTALDKAGAAIGPPFASANYLSTAISSETIITSAAATVGIFEFTGATLANNIVVGTTTSAQVEGWAAAALVAVDHHAATDFFLFIMYDTGTGSDLDAAILLFDGDVTLTGMLAAEFQLIAVVQGVTLDSFTFDNVQ